MVIQLFVSAIALFILWKAFLAFRANAMSIVAWIGWSFFWILAIVLVWQPAITDRVARVLQVGRGTDAVLYLSLLTTFYIFFRIFVSMERQRGEVTQLTREFALLEREHRRLKDECSTK